MSDISRAIAAKRVNIKKLQTDREALRRAAEEIEGVLGCEEKSEEVGSPKSNGQRRN